MILRPPKKARFTVIGNTLIENHHLSWAALGMKTHPAARPPGTLTAPLLRLSRSLRPLLRRRSRPRRIPRPRARQLGAHVPRAARIPGNKIALIGGANTDQGNPLIPLNETNS